MRIMGRCLKVLLVDDDSTCLVIVGAMLRKLHFQVETAKSPQDALGTLRAKGGFEFDVVISDVHMPDINGFELQMMISNEFNNLLPVVLMSGDNHEGVVRQGMQNGAISFIEKPVSANALTCLWRFLTSQRKCGAMEVPVETITPPAATVSRPGCSRGHGRAAAGGGGGGGSESTVAAVKKKMVWTDPLHFKFLDAVNTLGIENAVPKNILKAMNVKGLTRENVASHLQKYRQFLRRNIQQLQNGLLSNNNNNNNSGAGYQPRFAPKRVSRFAKLEQLFTHAQLEAAVSPSPSTSCAPPPPLSEHDESLFYRGWTRDPIAGTANSHCPSPETFFPNGSGEYESSSSCFGNFSVVPGNAEQSQNMGAAGHYYDTVLPENDDLLSGVLNFIGESEDGEVVEGYSSTCSYSTPQQFGESDMMDVSPQQDFPMDFPAAFGDWGENYGTYAAAHNPICELSVLQNMAAAAAVDTSGGYQFNQYRPNNDQQGGNEEVLMMEKYNNSGDEGGVGFEEWFDDNSQWLTQPFLQEEAMEGGVRYESSSSQLLQTSQQNFSHHYYSKTSHQGDNEDDDFVQSIFAANPYGGVGAANAQRFF